MKILGGRGQRRHEDVHADWPAEGEQAQEPERRNGTSENELHWPAVRLRSLVSDRASARLKSRSLTVSSRRSERAKSVRHLAENEVANVLGYALDLIDRPASARREHEALRPPVSAVLASLDEAGVFKRIEQANDRRPIERQGSRQLILPHRSFGPRDPKQGQPGCLGQPIACKRASTARRHSRAT